jgi:hypothetical protein
MLGKVQSSIRTGDEKPLESLWRNPEQCFWFSASEFGITFPMDPRKSGQAGTSCRADDYLSNLDCAALRAMTEPE